MWGWRVCGLKMGVICGVDIAHLPEDGSRTRSNAQNRKVKMAIFTKHRNVGDTHSSGTSGKRILRVIVL